MQNKFPSSITWEELEFFRLSNFFFIGLITNIIISFSMILLLYFSKEINSLAFIFFGSFFAGLGFVSILLIVIYRSKYKRTTKAITFYNKPKNAA